MAAGSRSVVRETGKPRRPFSIRLTPRVFSLVLSTTTSCRWSPSRSAIRTCSAPTRPGKVLPRSSPAPGRWTNTIICAASGSLTTTSISPSPFTSPVARSRFLPDCPNPYWISCPASSPSRVCDCCSWCTFTRPVWASIASSSSPGFPSRFARVMPRVFASSHRSSGPRRPSGPCSRTQNGRSESLALRYERSFRPSPSRSATWASPRFSVVFIRRIGLASSPPSS